LISKTHKRPKKESEWKLYHFNSNP
jgi:hypothetical protein